MKLIKEDVKTIIEVVTFGLLYMSVSIIDNPVFSYFFLAIWVAYLISTIYSKIRYRKGKENYLLVPTLNDDYSKMTSITLGLILVSLAIILAFWKPEIFGYNIIMFVVGILLFINGMLHLPMGRIEIDGNFLSITGLKDKIETKNIEALEIMANKIIIIDNFQKATRIDNFNIDTKSSDKIEDYFREKSGHIGFVVKNNVNELQ